MFMPTTVWKVSKYGFFFGLNTKIYGVNLRILTEYRKTRTIKFPYLDLDTFHAVGRISFRLALCSEYKKYSCFIFSLFFLITIT